jgi:hypothetical protein
MKPKGYTAGHIKESKNGKTAKNKAKFEENLEAYKKYSF